MAHSGEKGWDTSGRAQAYTGQPYGYRVVIVDPELLNAIM
jgi:hypothetical protein